MTVSKLYEYMSEKVIPESVMPQNITSILSDDDDSVVPELDAFTFLNRVRALGIGSADFLYLLKGCNAPAAAVEKIENNPAMNLQTLVVTLEESGLTAQDYTRMLYTARQIWERTLTMRIDNVRIAKKEAYDEPASDTEADTTEENTVLNEATAPQQGEKADAKEEQTAAPADNNDNDTHEQESALIEAESDTADEADIENDDKVAESDEVSAESKDADTGNDETVAESNEVATESEDEAAESADAKEEPAPVLTGRQRPKKEYSKNDDFDAFFDENKPVKRHKGKIAAAAVGAAVLAGLCVYMDTAGFTPVENTLPTASFAESKEALFAELFYAYNGGTIGGESVYAMPDFRQQLFGDMLISTPEELGCYTIGSSSFAVSPELITVYGEQEGALIARSTITPPEGARFTRVHTSPKSLTAVFESESYAGFATYDESGKQLHIIKQHGKPTDITIGADSISFGTVYVPPFTESFTVSDTEKYLPLYETGSETKTIPAESILSDGENSGCGYAVFGEYSTESGELISANAALGNPVYSDSEEFFAIMLTTEGHRLLSLGNDNSTELLDIAELIACDMGDVVMTRPIESAEDMLSSTVEPEDIQPLIATAEKNENGEIKIYLRGFDMQPISAITGVPEEMTSIYIEGGVLFICGENGVLNAADISNPEAPRFIEFTQLNGTVREDLALVHDISDKAVKLTLYKHSENGTVAELGSCTKPISPAEGKTAEMCGGNAVYIGDETLSGAAYTYFDGVSMISEFAVFGKTNTAFTLFDDKNGFTAAAELDGTVYLIYGDNSYTIEK